MHCTGTKRNTARIPVQFAIVGLPACTMALQACFSHEKNAKHGLYFVNNK